MAKRPFGEASADELEQVIAGIKNRTIKSAPKEGSIPRDRIKDAVEAVSANPKDKIGITKVQMSLVPASSIVYQALAMADGAAKYGPYNWRENSVQANIYVDAAMRHLMDWYNGVELTHDSKIPNLGAALACIGIIVDAIECGNLIDNRPKPMAFQALLQKWQKKL